MSQKQKIWIALVKERLYNLEWTQTQLAEAVGVTKSTISELFKYGKGSRKLKDNISKVLDIEGSED
ncbi:MULTISPECIES: helix-turn-helix domain-containing protein [Streptococcus]|jgi:transcriptional regulator with XRE-family HTH domain|uniref:helix-turn-helix domain-containing protein n=1 Tax=Streptococcus TaxID=1301 RepID=UPI0006617D59|nr:MULTISPECIES: helix-turn-helix transcriptional regulator [Streptococcus]